MEWTDRYVAGYLPEFLSESDDRKAVEQLHEAYAHGGGWQSFDGFRMTEWDKVGGARIWYPGDPPIAELSRTVLRGEAVILFRHEWVAVVQPDGAFEIARMD